MARFAVAGKVASRAFEAVQVTNMRHVADPLNGSTTATDQAAVEAAVALLEADAATPTQAHVNALRTVWNALVADIAIVPSNADVVVSYDATQVVTRTALRHSLIALSRTIEGTNHLTP